jgi:hypothetical protein
LIISRSILEGTVQQYPFFFLSLPEKSYIPLIYFRKSTAVSHGTFSMDAVTQIYQILTWGALLVFTLWFFVWCGDNDCFPLAWLILFVWAFYAAFPFVQFCFALLPILFLAYWIKKLFFPTFSFLSLLQREEQSQNSSNSSVTDSANNLEQISTEDTLSNRSTPVFLRKRAQRLGLTPTASPNASNSQPAQSAESSQPVPVEPIDPTLLPPSEDVPGQTVYRRIIPIQP